jgi:hypothetical protein
MSVGFFHAKMNLCAMRANDDEPMSAEPIEFLGVQQ